jgi:LytS/YehU family sensor histidine kinase
MAVLLYVALTAAWHGFAFYRRTQESRVQAERARAAVAEAREELMLARLRALKRQLNPHFLFNTLHSVASYVESDPRLARHLIASLGHLLRAVVRMDEALEIELERELDLLQQYLAIERVRFEDRLRVAVHVDPDARCAVLPPLLLQPLVENAIRHGIAPLERGGCVEVTVRREGARLAIEVRDDGAGVAPSRPSGRDGHGIGLSATRDRLRQMYGELQSLDVRSSPGRGTVVALRLPFRTEPRSFGA